VVFNGGVFLFKKLPNFSKNIYVGHMYALISRKKSSTFHLTTSIYVQALLKCIPILNCFVLIAKEQHQQPLGKNQGFVTNLAIGFSSCNKHLQLALFSNGKSNRQVASIVGT
jgi:hypothetical protein